MEIVALGDWTEDFVGTTTVSSRLSLGSPLDLHTIQNLRLIIETTGAHGDILCRLENDVNNYVEFSLGGDRTGAGGSEVLEQTLVKDLKDAVITQASDDFDPNDINSIYIAFVDDAGVGGTASVDKTTVALSSDAIVGHSLEFVEGFQTTLQSVLSASSTTLKTAHRPYDPHTGLPINETILISSDNVDVEVKDFDGNVVGVSYGECTWVEFSSIDGGTGVVTWDIIHSGLNSANLPPNLGSIRNSLRFTHTQYARTTIPLLKGLIQEGVNQVNSRKDEIENLLIGSIAALTRLANGTVSALKGVSIDATEKLIEGNANFRGISKTGGTDVAIEYNAYGQISDGHTGLDPELPIYIEIDGSIVQVSTGTTLEVGFALNDTQIWLYDAATVQFATQAEAEAGTDSTKSMSPLLTKQAIDKLAGLLGEVRQFDVSLTGAMTITELRNIGWAVCDGSTPVSQGISSPTIETTRNYVGSFIRGHATASGGNGGAATDNIADHTHLVSGDTEDAVGGLADATGATATGNHSHAVSITSQNGGAHTVDTVPPYYELVFMIKVK